jgi:hypothetical protein
MQTRRVCKEQHEGGKPAEQHNSNKQQRQQAEKKKATDVITTGKECRQEGKKVIKCACVVVFFWRVCEQALTHSSTRDVGDSGYTTEQQS